MSAIRSSYLTNPLSGISSCHEGTLSKEIKKKLCNPRHYLHLSLRGSLHEVHPVLPTEEHVDQQLQQVGLTNHRPEEQFSDEAGRDGLQHGGCEQDLCEALLVPWVKELDNVSQGMLSFLLQPLNKQSRL